VDSRHLVTPFNSKAMTLFPERIGGKIVVLLTANPDTPPAHLAFAFLDNIDELYDQNFWNTWYNERMSERTLDLLRSDKDHVEVGAPPIKTDEGWLLIYSHIQNYYSNEKIFGIEALLLDLDDPLTILGRTESALLVPD